MAHPDIVTSILTEREREIRLALTDAIFEYVVNGSDIDPGLVSDAAQYPIATEYVLSSVNEAIPRPIHPDIYEGIVDRVTKVNSWFSKLWELADDASAPLYLEEDDYSLPSGDPDSRYELGGKYAGSGIGSVERILGAKRAGKA